MDKYARTYIFHFEATLKQQLFLDHPLPEPRKRKTPRCILNILRLKKDNIEQESIKNKIKQRTIITSPSTEEHMKQSGNEFGFEGECIKLLSAVSFTRDNCGRDLEFQNKCLSNSNKGADNNNMWTSRMSACVISISFFT